MAVFQTWAFRQRATWDSKPSSHANRHPRHKSKSLTAHGIGAHVWKNARRGASYICYWASKNQGPILPAQFGATRRAGSVKDV